MNSSQYTIQPSYYLLYFYRKTIPKSPILFYLFISIKFISVYLITHNIEPDSTYLSISYLLQKLNISSHIITSKSINYSLLSLILNCILIVTVIIIFVNLQLIKKAQRSSDSSLYHIPNSKLSIAKNHKQFLKGFIYFFCIIVFFSHFIIEYFSYSFFFIYPSSINRYFLESHLVSLNQYNQRIFINKYFLCVINTVGIIIVFVYSYFFLLYSSYRTMTKSFGVQVYSTHKRIIPMIIIFHLHGAYSITQFFIPSYCKKIRFALCVMMMILLLLIFLLYYQAYNISTSVFGLVICFLCHWCLLSSIIEIITYISNIRNINRSFYFMKFVFEVCNGIFLTVGILAKNKSSALGNFQKCLFSNHKLKYLNYSLYEYFLLVQQSCENKSNFVWFYDFVINHRQYCTNENCQCQRNSVINSITPQSDPELLFKLLSSIGEELIVSSINRPILSQLSIIEEYYLLHVDFLISIEKKYFLSLYLCQYYLHQKSDRIGFLYGYYLFEINKLIFSKFKGKRLDPNELNNHIAKNQKKMIEIISIPKRFLLEQFKIDKIKQMIFFCISEFEKLMNYRYIKNYKKKITFNGDDILLPLGFFLKTRKKLLTYISAYCQKEEFPTVEIHYIITYAFNYLYDNQTQKEFKRFVPNITIYENDYDTIESIEYHYMILFLEPDDRFVVRYASVNLIEELYYKKKDFIGIDFNELIPKQISQEHFSEMKKFFANDNTEYKKETFLLTKDMNIIKVQVKCHNLPTASHFLSMILKISSSKKNEEKDMLCYNLLLNENFKFISTSLNFEKQFFFSIKMLNVLKIDFCQLFGLNNDTLMNRFKKMTVKKRKVLKNENGTLNSSILTSVKSEYHYLYDYTMNYRTERKSRPSMIVTEIVSKNKALNEIQKLENNIQELEKEWKERIVELYNRLRANKETQMSTDFKCTNTNFFIRIELRAIGFLFYYVVLIKEEILKTEYPLIDMYSELSNTQVNQYLNVPQLKSFAFLKNNQNLSCKSLFTKNSNHTPNNTGNTNQPYIVLTPNTITSNMNMISSIPNSSMMINGSSSKLGLVSHDLKLLHIAQKKTFKASNAKGFKEKNEYNKNTFILFRMQKALRIMKHLNRVVFLCVICLIAFNFIFNKITTQLSIDLFYVNSNSFLVKADIYFSSLAVITTCLIHDRLRGGDINAFGNRVKTRAADLLLHYSQLINNLNVIVNHLQSNELYALVYKDNQYDLLNKDWTYYHRKSSFGEEVYYMHMALVQFDISKEDSKCRIKEQFFNRKFQLMDEDDDSSEPSAEEKYLFYILFNVITKLSRKMDSITTKTNQIVKEYNNQAENTIDLLNLLILSFGILLYGMIFLTIGLFHLKFRYDMIKLFEQKKNDGLLRFQLSIFKKVIEDFGTTECKLFEKIIQSKTILPESITRGDVRQIIKKLTKTDGSIVLNNSKELQKNILTAKNIISEEDSSLDNKDFKKLVSLQRTQELVSFNSLFFVCFLTIEAVNMVLKHQFFKELMIQNNFAIDYLSRIPKFGELELYAIISVIFNDMNYITTEYSEYNQVVLANYYQIDLDIESDSLFQSLGNSHFAFIYYQLFITRRNIQLLTYDSEKSNILRRTKDLEILFNTKDNFCIYMPLYFIIYQSVDFTASQIDEIFSSVSKLVKECRLTSNGINLTGSKSSADLVIKQLCDMYVEHFKLNSEERHPFLFFVQENYLYIDENLQLPLKKLHNVNSYIIKEEIKVFYDNNQSLEFVMGSIILITNCAFVMILFFLLKTRIETYGNISVEMNDLLDKVLMNINN